VWRNTADGDDDDADNVIDPADSDTDVDKIAFGFMTWQPNATLLHHTSQSTGDTLDIKLVSFFYFIDTSVIYLFIYLFVMKSYMSTQRKIKKNQMNKELDCDTHNDSIIRSMSAAPTIENSTG